MLENFSEREKVLRWRRLWIALAESQRELGLAITREQVAELEANLERIDFEASARHERELRHDVMAQIHAWGELCPKARPILHLGATSCFVTDNADLLAIRAGLALLKQKLVNAIAALADFARAQRALPALGWTHLQPAQAVTVGKRACLWLQDLALDLEGLEHAEATLRFRGVKGTTGTQASFLELFGGDHAKVRELDRKVTARFGFERAFAVTGQTYPRGADFRVLAVLSSIAQSAHKFATDVRLLASRRELAEPRESRQIGSSAMPWKQNPMRCERICALARFVISALDNAAHTAANQWLERTLDDSANRRLAIAESFLATDALLILAVDVARGLTVNPAVVRANLAAELPFLASEHLLMAAVSEGADRQDVHEALRRASRAAAQAIAEGRPNPLRELIADDPELGRLAPRLDQLLDPARYVGRAPEQVDEFLAGEVRPLLERHRALLGLPAEVRV
jgi:adenylosuccinate lyase